MTAIFFLIRSKKQNKIKQNKTKQNKTKQNKTKQKQNKTKTHRNLEPTLRLIGRET